MKISGLTKLRKIQETTYQDDWSLDVRHENLIWRGTNNS